MPYAFEEQNTSLVKVNENFFKTTSITSSHSSVIKEKRESQNGGNKKTKPAKFPKNNYPLALLIRTCVYQEVGNDCFSFSLPPF